MREISIIFRESLKQHTADDDNEVTA